MVLILLISLINFTQVEASSWEQVWKLENLKNPESVVYHPDKQVLFVSNQNYDSKKGGGSISKISLDGKIIEEHWIKGLNEPKGIAYFGKKLFVSDVTDLVEVDLRNGEVVKRHAGPGAKFLNDVVVDDSGIVYVSDMFTSSIYRLNKNGDFKVWLQSAELENPNGIMIENGHLYIAAWGAFSNEKPLEAPPGRLLKVSLSNKSIEKISQNKLGNLDGIKRFGEGFLLSDWVRGGVYQFSKGQFQKIITTEQSSGDIEFIQDQEMIFIPMAKQGQVQAYKLSK